MLGRASRGYSIYEMDGRYLSPEGPVDERVLVIRFIFHNARDDADPKTDFLAASMEVINHLVAHRFAEELGVEEEIWFLEYSHPQLAIWRKDEAAVNLFVAHRQWMARLLRRCTEVDFARVGIHSEAGPKTLAELVATMVNHVDHHLRFLYGKRANLGVALPPRYTRP